MEFDCFVLADSAQVLGNKLFVLGGGWDTIWVRKFPTDHSFAICVGIRVPWEHTNEPHTLTIAIETADGDSVGEISGSFEAGKPAGMVKGSAQLICLAFTSHLRIEQPGRFQLRASIDGTELKAIGFSARPRAEGPGPTS